MAEGAGKYDDLATEVRDKAEARGVLVAVIHGTKGSVFSVQCDRKALQMAAQIVPEEPGGPGLEGWQLVMPLNRKTCDLPGENVEGIARHNVVIQSHDAVLARQ